MLCLLFPLPWLLAPSTSCVRPLVAHLRTCDFFGEDRVTNFMPRFPKGKVRTLSDDYSYSAQDADASAAGRRAGDQGYYDKDSFLKLVAWKSPRVLPRAGNNPEEFVREVTRHAISSRDERFRIEVLTLLEGVAWPVASVLLHFAFPNEYPILDFRALWSLGIDPKPRYNAHFWIEYTLFCRGLTNAWDVDMRTLDKALWQYSKVRQSSVSDEEDEGEAKQSF
jgi:hypothetical protein